MKFQENGRIKENPTMADATDTKDINMPKP
jgi:hypothetical protein